MGVAHFGPSKGGVSKKSTPALSMTPLFLLHNSFLRIKSAINQWVFKIFWILLFLKVSNSPLSPYMGYKKLKKTKDSYWFSGPLTPFPLYKHRNKLEFSRQTNKALFRVGQVRTDQDRSGQDKRKQFGYDLIVVSLVEISKTHKALKTFFLTLLNGYLLC